MHWVVAALVTNAAVAGLAYAVVRRCRPTPPPALIPLPVRAAFRRRMGAVLLFALALGGLAAAFPGDPPVEVVEVPSPMPSAWTDIKVPHPGRPVTVKTKDDKAARWVLIQDKKATLRPSPDGKSADFVAEEPGEYLALAIVESGEPARLRYTVGGKQPDPAPKPDPVPDPDDGSKPKPHPKPPVPPTPGGAVKAFVVVEDTAKPGTFRGDILGSRRSRRSTRRSA
jgi:hypothetical protein